MNINQYLESTYLKTSEQAGCTEAETKKIVIDLIKEAIVHQFKLVMLRPQFVQLAKKIIQEVDSAVLVGTVIGFHEGTNTITQKLKEATKAIENEADELDFVINYTAFINGDIDLVREEVLKCTQLALDHQKKIKWIIEIAALSNTQIIAITKLIRTIVLDHFEKKYFTDVYVKSSTGFYKTENNEPNGATVEGIELMLSNANPLPVKAAGGVKSYKDALEMINLGVSRIGTSSAKAIVEKQNINSEY